MSLTTEHETQGQDHVKLDVNQLLIYINIFS